MTNTVGAPPAPGRPTGLSWSRTVPRELVHRASVAEVLLTDVRRDPCGGFEAAAWWPRSHRTFPADGSDLHSPLLVVETLRQLGIYLPLRWFGVSPAAHLVIADLFFTLLVEREPRAGHGGSEVACRVAVEDVRRHGDGSLAGLRLDVEFRARGRAFGRAGGGARFLAADRYAAVRADRIDGRQPPPRLDGRPRLETLAVSHRADVVVSRRDGALVVDPADPRHPFYFDHPSDHVPGMVLLEAARQATAEASDGTLQRPTAGRLVAERFTEYTPAARVEAVPHHRTCVFRIRQGPALTAYGTLQYGR
jgi:hypothetical protein